MRYLKPTEYTGNTAWEAMDIDAIDGATVRMHWTDQAYIWHVNNGPEVFVLLAGSVRMHWRRADGSADSVLMAPGDIIHCETGDEHKAEPLVPSRILVVERAGSI